MTFDEELQRAMDALGTSLREQAAAEVNRRVEEARAQAEDTARRWIEEAREQAATEARAQAEEDCRVRLERAREEAAEDARVRVDAARAQAEREADARVEEARAQAAREAEQRAEDARAQAARDAERRLQEALAQASRDADVRMEAVGAQAARDADARVAEIRAQAAQSDRRAEEAAEHARVRTEEAEARAEEARATAEEARANAQEAERARAEAEARAAQPVARGVDDELQEAIRALDQARTLGGILDALVAAAAREAGRAALLLVRGHSLQGWRFSGFGHELESPADFVLPLTEGGVVADAVAGGALSSSAANGHQAAPAFAQLPAGQPCVAVPLMLSGEVVAVLYADATRDGASAGELSTVALEILARHASRCLEVITAFKAAHVLVARETGAGTTGSAHRDDDAEESARRYARLLVSEIRLYHEADVAEGRVRRDLGTRLASEIARARVLYEQRVPPDVRRRADYFHAELVRTLADGDARLLEASGS